MSCTNQIELHKIYNILIENIFNIDNIKYNNKSNENNILIKPYLGVSYLIYIINIYSIKEKKTIIYNKNNNKKGIINGNLMVMDYSINYIHELKPTYFERYIFKKNKKELENNIQQIELKLKNLLF